MQAQLQSKLAEVRKFFFELHICLKDAWLQACLSYVLQMCRTDAEIKAAIFHQWVLVPIAGTSQPVLGALQAQLSSRHYFVAMVLQIKQVDDISSSRWSQSKRARGAKTCDNPEFRDGDDMDETAEQWNHYREDGPRFLRLMVTDGLDTLKAVEYRRIPAISVHTPPGTKVLLYGSHQSLPSRRDVFLLTPQNFQVLGGPSVVSS